MEGLAAARGRVGAALRWPEMLRRAALSALGHDCLNLAQSAAYSAMVSLFPAMIVAAAAIALLPDAAPLREQVGGFFGQVLPESVMPLLTRYFSAGESHTAKVMAGAVLVSLTGASSTLATLMEGMMRAQEVDSKEWGFVARRQRALVLVPVALLPLVAATVLVVFGQFLTHWVAGFLANGVRPVFFAAALVVRWVVALTGVAGLTAMLYHWGTPRRGRWTATLPGAIAATLLWFVSTLGFGWYVTRFANYSQVYGSLGAGIALLLWLYIVFLSVLCGAEFNAQFARREAVS